MKWSDRLIILLVAAVGLAGAGYMIWLQTQVDDLQLDEHPQQQQSS